MIEFQIIGRMEEEEEDKELGVGLSFEFVCYVIVKDTKINPENGKPRLLL